MHPVQASETIEIMVTENGKKIAKKELFRHIESEKVGAANDSRKFTLDAWAIAATLVTVLLAVIAILP